MATLLASNEICVAEESLLIRADGWSVPGSGRESKEDRFYIDPGQRFFLVADGIGGSRAGDVASDLAIRLLSRGLDDLCSSTPTAPEVELLLRQCIAETNDLILAHRGNDRRLARMGTTAAVALISETTLYAAGLGDSRVYLVRDGRARQLTVDHTIAQGLFDSGILTLEQFQFHPYRNVLHKYLGCAEIGDGPCLCHVELREDDSILTASDGLTDHVDEEQLAQVISDSPTPGDACEKLVRLAVERGSTDDITCVVAFVDALPFEDSTHVSFLSQA